MEQYEIIKLTYQEAITIKVALTSRAEELEASCQRILNEGENPDTIAKILQDTEAQRDRFATILDRLRRQN